MLVSYSSTPQSEVNTYNEFFIISLEEQNVFPSESCLFLYMYFFKFSVPIAVHRNKVSTSEDIVFFCFYPQKNTFGMHFFKVVSYIQFSLAKIVVL